MAVSVGDASERKARPGRHWWCGAAADAPQERGCNPCRKKEEIMEDEMEDGRTNRWVGRFMPIAVAVVGLAAASVPFTAVLAQSKNRVNCYDVDPIYHMNLITNPTCEGYWNHGLVNPYYDPAHPYAGYGYGYPYYGYAQPYYPW